MHRLHELIIAPIDQGNYNSAPTFPVYPPGKFDYEIPDNLCFQENETYQTSDSYFPGRQTYDERIVNPTTDPRLVRRGCKLAWCPKMFWDSAGLAPLIPPGQPWYTGLPTTPPALSSLAGLANPIGGDEPVQHSAVKYYPKPPVLPIDPLIQRSAVSSPLTDGPNILSDLQVKADFVSPLLNDDVNDGGMQTQLISPGEQENMAHRGVRNNRYPGQKIKSNVFMRNDTSTNTAPYSNSLYLTPYDATKNMISTGKIVNNYTGEIFETFENQLPPPNTTKGAIPAYQLKQPNVKLMYSQGGYNHRNPPPRKSEQPGYVFNPVSARGGSNPFGDAVYAPKIQARVYDQVSRSVYNNRNGDYAVEPSMNGEKPKNMFGLVPRMRYVPYITPTNNLDDDECTKRYVSIPENAPTNLMLREQYTGEFFNRKDKLLVHRDPFPDTFVNGVEAVGWFPVTTDKIGPMRADFEQSYIPMGYMNSGNTIRPLELNKAGKTNDSWTVPTAGDILQNDVVGTLILPSHTVKDTQKDTFNTSSRVASGFQDIPNVGIIMSETNLRDTQKDNVNTSSRAASGFQDVPNVGIIMSETNLRDTQKDKINTSSRVASGLQDFPNVGLIMSEANLRETQKITDMFPVRGVDAASEGDVVISSTVLRDTQKLEEMLPTGQVQNINGVESGIVITDKLVRDTLKIAIADNPFRLAPINPLVYESTLRTNTTLKDTQKESFSGSSFPKGPVDLNSAGSLMIVDRTIRQPVCRTKAQFQNHVMALDGEDRAQSILPQQMSTLQHRGVCNMLYVPSPSMVPAGAGDTSTRSITQLNKLPTYDPEAVIYRQSLPSMPDTGGGNHSLFPDVRSTLRADKDMCELARSFKDA